MWWNLNRARREQEGTAEVTGAEMVVDQSDASPINEPRPPLVRSTVYVFRALVGLFLLLVGMGLLLVFENALLGVREDIATIQEAWPEWLTSSVQVAIGITFAVAVVGNKKTAPAPSPPPRARGTPTQHPNQTVTKQQDEPPQRVAQQHPPTHAELQTLHKSIGTSLRECSECGNVVLGNAMLSSQCHATRR